jgi:hypothetical protein
VENIETTSLKRGCEDLLYLLPCCVIKHRHHLYLLLHSDHLASALGPCGLFLIRYAASHSIGLGGRSRTSADMPCSRIGTTVWSRYARIGSPCTSALAGAASAACSAALTSSLAAAFTAGGSSSGAADLAAGGSLESPDGSAGGASSLLSACVSSAGASFSAGVSTSTLAS